MNAEDFEVVFEQRVALCRDTLVTKAKEYAKEDRLYNFKKAANLQNISNRQALGGMLAKHIISIFDLIQNKDLADQEMWDEKIGDALCYLFLLKALIVEEGV